MSTPTIYAYDWVPSFAEGYVRDLRLRWALREAGIPYHVKLISHEEKVTANYRKLQPFCQVPAFEEGSVRMFESGAIALYIAEKSEALLPRDLAARTRAQTWVVAALNTLEPAVAEIATIDLFSAGEEWARLRRPSALELLNQRLTQLSEWLGEKQFLEAQFTVGDLIMTTVLRDVREEVLKAYPNLLAYRTRHEARLPFQTALAEQIADFRKSANRP